MSTTDTRAAFEAHIQKESRTDYERNLVIQRFDSKPEEYRLEQVQSRWKTWQAATEAAKAEQQAGAIDKDLLQATNLAKAIWHRHYRETAPHWQPMETLSGVISQIDNMVCTLVLPPAAKATGTAGELPPLPAGFYRGEVMYTADQMREYGQACAEAARQAAPVALTDDQAWDLIRQTLGYSSSAHDGTLLIEFIEEAGDIYRAIIAATNRSQP